MNKRFPSYGVKHPRGPPMIFHCSAGIGRSGVCIMLDIITEMLNHNEFVDPLQVVVDMRRQRYHSIHTKDQLLFAYDYIIQLCKHNRYGLLTVNG
uniref:Uncharacterized protein n=1 Tax=Romanomermis culicivorax TaxID=13658 RepID=A0A915IZ79_ROMCU